MEAITNFDFFRAIETRVTEGMQEAEKGMHKEAEEACEKLGLEINEQMPVEGYYSGNVILERYFRAMKTLMDPKNFSDDAAAKARTIEEIAAFHDFVQNPVFGPQQFCRDAFNEDNVYDPGEPQQIISGRADAVTLATHRMDDPGTLTIPNILKKIRGMRDHGEGLVAYGILVDSKESQHNPRALAMALETNVLYRAKGASRGMPAEPEWKVDDDIFRTGNLVLELYNGLLGKHQELIGRAVQIPTFDKGDSRGVEAVLDKGRTPIRCVNIHTIQLGGAPEFYHWATYWNGRGNLEVYDFIDNRIVTTAEAEKNPTQKYSPLRK